MGTGQDGALPAAEQKKDFASEGFLGTLPIFSLEKLDGKSHFFDNANVMIYGFCE